MIMFCCCEPIHDSYINWESITAISTTVLAGFTTILAIAAIVQLIDVKKLIKQNENIKNILSAENIIVTQIEFHYRIIEKIDVNIKDAFRRMYENLRGNYGFETSPSIEAKIEAAFAALYENYGYLLGHYYRNLYRIFKNINETKIKGFDKKYYAKLVRAQLSEYEILLLFYNCIWVKDEYKFKKLVEVYGLLEGINYEKLFKRDHYKLYSESAFGNDLI
jgi:hypothetical protein